MSETVGLSNFATIANAMFNSVTANATAIQSMSVGGHMINATAFAGTANNATNLGGVAAASYQLNSTLAANVATMTANAATFANSSSTNTFTVGTAAYFVANGNVGIGTASPAIKLEVVGPGRFSNSSFANGAAGTNLVLRTPGAAQGEVAALSLWGTFTSTTDNGPRRIADITSGFSGGAWGNEYLSFNVGTGGGSNDGANTNLERIRITGNGNVGIGTSTPSVRLEIAAVSSAASDTWAGGTDFLELTAASGSAFSEQAIVFQETGTNIGAKIGVKNRANGAYDILFATRDNSSTTSTMTERMRIAANGNIGIGNSTPANPFVISDKTTDPSVFITASNSTFVAVYGTQGYGSQVGFISRRADGTAASPLATGGGNRLCYLIGASSPDGNTWFNSTAINFHAESTTNSTSAASYMNFMTTGTGATSRTERMRITSGGNVGIGTSSPNATLAVTGTANVSGNVVVGGSLNAANVTATLFTGNLTGTAASATSPVFAGDAVNRANITTRVDSGFYEHDSGTTAEGWPVNDSGWQHMISCTHSNDGNYFAMQIAATFGGQNWYFRNTNGGGTQAWSTMLHSGNFNSYAPTLTGTGASGNWGINVTGNAATVTNGVYTTGTQTITGQKSFNTDNTSIANANGGLSRLEVLGTGGAAFMTFHRPGAFAAYFGLDSDNVWKVGGWSTGSVAYPILHSNNFNSYSPTLTGTGASGNWGINVTGNAATVTNGVYTSGDQTIGNTKNFNGSLRNIVSSGWSNFYLGGGEGGYLWMHMGGDNTNELRFGRVNRSTFNWEANPFIMNMGNGIFTVTGEVRTPVFRLSSDANSYWAANEMVLRGASPTIFFRDTDHNSAMLHNNSSLLYVLRGGNDTTSWNTVGSGWWPLTINLTNNDISLGGNISAAYNIIAYASDKRLKENIKEIPDAIEKIKKIRGVTFDWRDKADELGFKPERKYNDVGVIAQEIEEVLPQVVTLAPFDKWIPDPGTDYSAEELQRVGMSRSGENYKTVQYDRVVPLLIQAIKELTAKVEALEARG
ncbi:Intramolecular chaperone auto-processing domain containing protein [uncultured Caudovirales phage]|uniref:Intramolecular chaperone auto-processing domain containing protein n=1 Tax=uncultured Caudovirales phage TaxID=2100421 RepID=A0A6J5M3D2_9CAUD|nr:Intramolecular chaperone auto-processing domain containing protein [uncultured Caudovirales phage]